jgi:hypothetical protein
MAEFQPFNLGQVFQTAEGIKAARSQSTVDRLREQYMGEQIENSKFQRETAQRQQQVVLGQDKAKQIVAKAGQILQQQGDVKGYIERFEPDLVKNLTQNGADWATMDENQIREVVTAMQNHANQELGVAPSGPDPKMELDRAKFDEEKRQHDERLAFDQKKLQHEQSAGRQQQPVNQQLITRPMGNGMVQDFAWDPRTNSRVASGEPYKPVTTHTGNVTEGERKAAALGTRLDAALTALNEINAVDPSASKPGLIERGLETVGMEAAANVARSSERQQADTAQLDALDAALTLATGAAYTKEQLQNLRKSYFPQIGDTDAQVKAKQKRFETIVKTARIAAGRAEPSIDKANRGATGTWDEPQKVGAFTVRRIK